VAELVCTLTYLCDVDRVAVTDFLNRDVCTFIFADHTQQISHNGQLSAMLDVLFGVPQSYYVTSIVRDRKPVIWA